MSKKYSILFVCMGNICRSPSAEEIFRNLVESEGLSKHVFIDSAGILDYHEGELPDKRMRDHAWKRGYKLNSLSRPVTIADFDRFDLIIGMDDSNYDRLRAMAPNLDVKQKVRRMAHYLKRYAHDHIPDPYYGGASGFELVLDLLEDASAGLLEEVRTVLHQGS